TALSVNNLKDVHVWSEQNTNKKLVLADVGGSGITDVYVTHDNPYWEKLKGNQVPLNIEKEGERIVIPEGTAVGKEIVPGAYTRTLVAKRGEEKIKSSPYVIYVQSASTNNIDKTYGAMVTEEEVLNSVTVQDGHAPTGEVIKELMPNQTSPTKGRGNEMKVKLTNQSDEVKVVTVKVNFDPAKPVIVTNLSNKAGTTDQIQVKSEKGTKVELFGPDGNKFGEGIVEENGSALIRPKRSIPEGGIIAKATASY
ncbi:hypothetical protein ACWEWU_14825, partial [Staphylococcus xylosus]